MHADGLQFVQVWGQVWQTFLKTLALTDVLHGGEDLAAWLERIASEDLPVVEHALWESLATGVGSVQSRKHEVERKKWKNNISD